MKPRSVDFPTKDSTAQHLVGGEADLKEPCLVILGHKPHLGASAGKGQSPTQSCARASKSAHILISALKQVVYLWQLMQISASFPMAPYLHSQDHDSKAAGRERQSSSHHQSRAQTTPGCNSEVPHDSSNGTDLQHRESRTHACTTLTYTPTLLCHSPALPLTSQSTGPSCHVCFSSGTGVRY